MKKEQEKVKVELAKDQLLITDLICREWKKSKRNGRGELWHYRGWFLFGIIPLYIVRW